MVTVKHHALRRIPDLLHRPEGLAVDFRDLLISPDTTLDVDLPE